MLVPGVQRIPRGSNAAHWVDARFDAAFTTLETERAPAQVLAQLRIAHELLVDDAPWL
ncbi:MAG: ABC-type transport system, substrate-binding protein, partial [Rhodospirillales bacterium]|nr:ABC-type transport system, substrate-binding protein [Rhodospirillales bacterium]